MLFSLQIDQFLRYIKFEKRLSDHTYIAYKNDLADFEQSLYITDPTAGAIQSLHVRNWLATLKAEQGVSATTFNRKKAALSSFFKYALLQGWIKSNPVKSIPAQKAPQRIPQYLQEKETEQWIDKYPKPEIFKDKTDLLIALLLYNCGLRRSEVINLKLTDWEKSLQQIRVLGKGNKERLIPINDALQNQLEEYVSWRKALFPDATVKELLLLENGKPLYPNYIYRLIKDQLSELSTISKKSPHVLRHTFATQMLQNGANIQAIKDLLGHSSLASTQVYTHANIDLLKDIHKKAHPKG